MRTMEFDPTLSPGGGQFNLKGYILYAVNGAIVEKPIRYMIEAHRTYSIEDSLMSKNKYYTFPNNNHTGYNTAHCPGA